MKKIKALLTIALLSTMLTSCGGNSSNTSNISSSTSTSTSVNPELTLFEECLAKLKQNYKFEGTITLKSGSTASKYINEVSISDGCYNSISYEAVASTGDIPTKDTVSDELYYGTKGNSDYAYNIYLGLDNTVHYKLLTSSSTSKPLKWSSTNFINPFTNLTINDFTKVASGYKLRTTTSTQLTALSMIGNNLSGGLNADAKSVVFSIEDGTIKCNISYDAVTTSSGSAVTVSITGSFTAFGDNLTKLPVALTDTDATLDDAIKSLQCYNWEFTDVREATLEVGDEKQSAKYKYVGKTDATDFLLNSYSVSKNTSGVETETLSSSTGMKAVHSGTKNAGLIQVTQAKDLSENTNYYYQDGAEMTGYTLASDFFPEYNLSSAFFTKDTSKSTSTKSVYVFKNNVFPVQEYSKNYSPIESYFTFDGFTITLDNSDSSNPTISFTNTYQGYYQYSSSYTLPMTITDTITYSNIGKVTKGSLFNDDDIKTDCSNLVWSDSWATACGYYNNDTGAQATPEGLFGDGMTSDVMDEYVPMLGGVYPTYDISAYNNEYFLLYSTDSTSTLQTMLTAYATKLTNAGYSTPTYDSSTYNYSATKTVTIDGASKVITVSFTVLSGSSTYYLAITPSIADATSGSTNA